MKKLALLVIALLFLGVFSPTLSKAQGCSQCAASTKNGVDSEKKTGLGVNAGIMFLMVIPYLAAGVIGTIWYVTYKRKSGEGSI